MFKTKKIKNLIIAVCFILAIFIIGDFAYAQDANSLLFGGKQGTIGDILGLGSGDPRIIIASIIRVLLGFLGILAVGYIMYAGFLWMTSEGDEGKVETAKNTLKNAFIGLVIILTSFGIASFVISKLYSAGTGGGPGGGGPGGGSGLAALGSGIIESHYPARNQKDVPRNTKIVITFKEPMDISTIIKNTNGNALIGDWNDTNTNGKMDPGEYDTVNDTNILIYKTIDGSDGPYVTDVYASRVGSSTFIFKPMQYLGSPSENIDYTVALTKDIKKANGDAAFTKVVGAIGYYWSFEVGTFIDTTPPKVESVIPAPSSTEPRNVIIQINFNEALDPSQASGKTADSFSNIEVSDITSGTPVAGIFYISNQYKTVEFLTENKCGTNSCGNDVFCLPGNIDLSVLARAATLMVVGETFALIPYDGIIDMADNSLDGNKDGKAVGPQAQSGMPAYDENAPDPLSQGDDYTWAFKTNNTIDITAPKIKAIDPNIGVFDVGLSAVPEATFDKLLSAKTANSSNAILSALSGPISYSPYLLNDVVLKEGTVKISHDTFNNPETYKAILTSGIQDIYQNCYSPCSGVNVAGAPVTGTPSCCEGLTTGGATCP
jgi:hypothetical protein